MSLNHVLTQKTLEFVKISNVDYKLTSPSVINLQILQSFCRSRCCKLKYFPRRCWRKNSNDLNAWSFFSLLVCLSLSSDRHINRVQLQSQLYAKCLTLSITMIIRLVVLLFYIGWMDWRYLGRRMNEQRIALNAHKRAPVRVGLLENKNHRHELHSHSRAQ